MKVDIKIRKASESEAKAFRAAGLHLGETMEDADFWYLVALDYPNWNNKLQVEGDVPFEVRDQTFKEFKDMVLSGADKFNTKEDGDIDIDATFYYSFKRVVGYTLASTYRTWANRNIFKGFDLADIAGNQGHEYTHNLGLGHKGADRRSVSYQWGYAIRDFIKIKLGLESTIKIKYRRSFWTRVKRVFRGLF